MNAAILSGQGMVPPYPLNPRSPDKARSHMIGNPVADTLGRTGYGRHNGRSVETRVERPNGQNH